MIKRPKELEYSYEHGLPAAIRYVWGTQRGGVDWERAGEEVFVLATIGIGVVKSMKVVSGVKSPTRLVKTASTVGKVATRDEIIFMLKLRPNLIVEEASGDMLTYLNYQGARASHILMENGKSVITYTKDATKWDIMHEYMHYMFQNKWKNPRIGEDTIIESFLNRHQKLFNITPK
ncbi:hypothetical protein [Thermospira aquatica]|uniref:Tox-MPTase4 domain-containing protein n=1 Tax=Thermospira aquatica TaxID=2828656 RepID=A0AAX3BET5_9SPIR|nr:hypothetical protein [Thermospira aquatica]URA10623.1 hypothetical protein KDW03_02120 [Thermospira aquatica]